MADEITGGRAIAQTLKRYGVSHVFFMEAILREALIEMEEAGIARVLVHEEKGAVYMADGYARASRKPAVCMAQSVGAANLASGLQDPYLGQSAVIAITGRKPPTNQYRNAYQEIVHEPLFVPVTKFSGRVDDPDQLPFLLRQAFRVATTGTPGPVHLDVIGVLGEICENARRKFALVDEPDFSQFPAFRPLPNPEEVRRAASAIDAARRPVILVGQGAIRSGAEAAVKALAEKLSAGVVETCDAKHVLTEEHPLNAGVTGTYSRRCANQVLSEADLVVVAGCEVGDQATTEFRLPVPGTAIVQVDIDPVEIGRNFAGALGVMGDVRMALEQLTGAVATGSRGEWTKRIAELVGAWRAEVQEGTSKVTTPLRPDWLCVELGKLLPRDAVVFADTGLSAWWTSILLGLSHPTQNYHRAAGSLGWAMPAAMGGKCALPDRPVIAFCGDGGFMYHLAELETARRCGIKTITVVNNNSWLAQDAESILAAYGQREGRKEELYVYRELNFAKYAEWAGCLGLRVEKASELAPAFAAAMASPHPAVIDVVTNPEILPARPWRPR